jgi:glutathione synthase/RimK-type ligase-like ATP-grasp enzyme
MKTIIETPEEVHARMFRMAAEAVEQGDLDLAVDIAQAVVIEINSVMNEWKDIRQSGVFQIPGDGLIKPDYEDPYNR